MKLKKGKKEFVILAFICVDKTKKEFKIFDIRKLEGYTLTDGKSS